VAAEVLGLPHAAIVVLGAGGFIVPEVARPALERLRAAFALPAEDGMRMLHRHLTLTPFPFSYRDPADPLPGRVLPYRDPIAADEHAPARRVYVTLGTIFNTESGDLLERVVAGVAACAEADAVLVTTGVHVDESSWGPLPAKVTTHRFVPQDRALASCSAVVSHGGSGTVLGAIRHGLPTVILPLGADQSLNARRCDQLGLGLSLRADTAGKDDICSAVHEILTEPSYRRSARQMRARLLQLPDLGAALAAVESLAHPAASLLNG
jgi:UDP:flavonoid glycosyltransferase YjiC (YdhE family)